MSEDYGEKIRRVEQIQQKEGILVDQERHVFDRKMQDLGVTEKRDVIQWRKIFSIFMLFFLPIQYIVVITLLVFQGLNAFSFQLNGYIFHTLIFGTFAQSCFLVRIIFKYMFSHKK